MSHEEPVRVRDIMKTNFDMVDRMDTVAKALDTMRHSDTKCLVVRKRHEDDEYGIVLLSDIAREVLAVDRAPDRVNIYEIMSKPVLSVRPEMDIRYCARIFLRFGISAAPVIQGGEILGIVAYDQLVLKGLAAKS